MAGDHTGSRSKISPEITAGLVRLISSGVPYETAADSVRIGETTLYSWLRKGKKSKKKTCPYRHLVQELKKAHADAITRNVAIVQKAAAKAWQAAAWWLERREQKRFGLNRKELNDLRAENSRLKAKLTVKLEIDKGEPEVVTVLLTDASQGMTTPPAPAQ